jgi:hypothetical protein
MVDIDPLDAAKSKLDPFKSVTESIINSNFAAKNIRDTIAQIEASAAEVAISFGQGREEITSIKAGLADAADKVYLLGGNWSKIVEIQKASATELGRNVILSSESYEKFYATTQVTGIANQKLIEGFKNAGFSLYEIGNQMEKVVSRAREIGVNAQAVSGQVIKNMSSMNVFNFQGGVDGMAKMAAQAVNLRVDMTKTLDIAKGLFNPEKAIEMASAMQRLGVAQGALLDPLKLMDLAQNDPAELQNQIAQMSKQFVQLNADGHFEIMPGAKRQLMEIGAELGMNNGELERMALGGAELEQKMGKIQFPEFATKEQQEMLANITEMGKNGEMKIKVDGKDMDINAAMEKFGTDEESFDKLIEASKPKEMIDLATEQLDTQKTIAAYAASMSGRVPRGMAAQKISTQADDAMRLVGKKTVDTFDPFSSKKIGEAIGGGIEGFITSVNSGGNKMEALGVAGGKVSDFFTGSFMESLTIASDGLKKLGESTNPWIELTFGMAKKGINKLKEYDNSTTQTSLVNPTGNVNPVSPLVTPTGNVNPMSQLIPPTGNVNPPETKSLETIVNNSENVNNPNEITSNMKVEDVNVNLNIKIDAPSNVDTAQLILAFNDQSVKGALISAFQTALSNANGSNGTNPIESRKQMAKLANA